MTEQPGIRVHTVDPTENNGGGGIPDNLSASMTFSFNTLCCAGGAGAACGGVPLAVVGLSVDLGRARVPGPGHRPGRLLLLTWPGSWPCCMSSTPAAGRRPGGTTGSAAARPATLVMAWTFFPAQAAAVFRHSLPADDATWARGRGWALWKALITLSSGKHGRDGGQAAARRLG
jgi:hypothetical protein